MQGLFKKVAIADPIGALVFLPFNHAVPQSAADVLIAAFGFYIQLYCDFSGYTDIGRGSALLLGIRLPFNFNLPYLARNISDFWRRWHISLSSWLRDYVYIPLGGSRGSSLLSWRNTMITFLLCGLWHGASWHFVLFGGFHGIGLVINREWNALLDRLPALKTATDNWAGHSLAWLLTQVFVVVGFAIFRVPDIAQMMNLLTSLKNVHSQCFLMGAIEKAGVLQISAVYMLAWMLTEYMIRQPKALSWLRDGAQLPPLHYSTPVRLAAWTAACFLMFAVKPTTDVPFVYFQF
jgi:D-alanyl-lipoteichoic acid acyltransferase DltB (MBOAT superfamily)